MLGGVVLLGTISAENGKADKDNRYAEKHLKIQRVKNPVLRVFYRTDTIENISPILLFNDRGRIYRHYKKGDDLYRMRLYLFEHEAWHTHNLKVKKFLFSPRQYERILVHDEISANLLALNSMILEYCFTDNKEKFLKTIHKDGSFYFYFKEVENGNINPLSNDSSMMEKDYHLRINGMLKTWMKRSYNSYKLRHKNMIFNYIKGYGLNDDNVKNYNKAMHHMYTMGGIDFWNYVDKDIEIKEINLFDGVAKIKSFAKKDNAMMEEIKKYAPLLEKIEDDSQRIAALQHLILSSEIKAKISKNNYEIDDKIVTILYNKAMVKYAKDNTFSIFVGETQTSSNIIILNEDKKCSLEDFIAKVYNFKGIDLSRQIKDFDVYNLPYDVDKLGYDYQADDRGIVLWNDVDEMLAANVQHNDNERVAGKNKKKYLRNNSRRSGILFVDVPNFEEPILTASTPVQMEILKKTYEDFYNMPEVKEFEPQEQKTQLKAGFMAKER